MRTEKIVVKGLVQGIGYRPFVAELADKYKLNGFVKNTAGIVTICVSGMEQNLKDFRLALRNEAPPGARVDEIICSETGSEDFFDFQIRQSDSDCELWDTAYIPPDLPTCAACEQELFEEGNRRYRHPFISCTACGPRYSIIKRLPYDRCNITMDDFGMCAACREEYTQRANMRRHAQTIACRECGPKLEFAEVYSELSVTERLTEEAALKKAVLLLKSGGILAVKDIGGFHLACLPYAKETVCALRSIKGRERKPLAVMFSGMEEIRRHCHVCGAEETELNSAARPIVLLKRKQKNKKEFAFDVCKNSPDIGAMLPGNPLQILLLKACGALIMTSANVSGEPMIIKNKKMWEWMCQAKAAAPKVSLGVLAHEREILTPLDDSVVRIVNGKRQVIRRARGFVPEPVWMGRREQNAVKDKSSEVFCAGADLKACFCYTNGARAYLSQHFGDLAGEEVISAYEAECVRMKRLFGFRPQTVVTDMHPAYHSVALARDMGHEIIQVQHHHAHIASVMAEHGLREALGVAFDGTGYGTDGSIWGSEFLYCRKDGMERLAHLMPMELIGGDEGARNADAILYAMLANLHMELPEEIFWLSRKKYQLVKAAVLHRINTVKSSSMGRLFDAVSALLDICHLNGYEGEAAIELEYLAAKTDRAYALSIDIRQSEGELLGDIRQLFLDLIEALLGGREKAELARGFLYAVADFVTEMCVRLGTRGKTNIALSGGTFQNQILLERVWENLKREGFFVYRNELVPAGDGGICLGQAYIVSFG